MVDSPDGDTVVKLRLDQLQALSASWLRRLLGEAGWDASSSSLSPEHAFIVGPQDGLRVSVTPLDAAPWIAAECSDRERQGEVDELVPAGRIEARIAIGARR
jgi:hypothetical protein